MKKKMRKILVLSLLVVVLVASQSIAYGGQITPYYNKVSAVDSWMNIINVNTLVYGVEVFTSSPDKLDYIHIDAELRKISGSIVYTYSENLVKSGCIYTFSKSRTAYSRGTYFLKYTLYCYKDGELVDEISKNTVTATY